MANRVKKELLTPKNVDLIKRIFSERVDCIAKDDEEKIIRKFFLNKLIKYAQSNITKKVNSVARQVTL